MGRPCKPTCPTCGQKAARGFTLMDLPQHTRILDEINNRLKHIDSKAQTGIVSTAALQKQVQELHSALVKTQRGTTAALAFMLELLGDKDASEHARAIVKDFLNTVIPNER